MRKVFPQPEMKLADEDRGGHAFEGDETTEGTETQEGHSDSTPPEEEGEDEGDG